MRQVKRWRYYCDFCKKAGGQKNAIAKHERGCTANPGRICGLCGRCGEVQAEMSELTSIVNNYCKDMPKTIRDDGGKPIVEGQQKELDPMIELLDEATQSCPACMLAALRQADVCVWTNFDFKKRLDDWWADENANNCPDYAY